MASPNFTSGTFNLGTDLSVTVIDNDTGAPISLAGRLVSFKADPKVAKVQQTPIDGGGLTQHRQAFQGWTGTIVIDRADGDLDQLQALMESNYYQQGLQKYFTIGQNVRNQFNKTVDSFSFLFCAMEMETSGDWKAADKVQVTLKFDAQQRVPS